MPKAGPSRNIESDTLQRTKSATASLSEKLAQQRSRQSVKHPTTYTDTLVHLLKGSIGAGIFAMGYAFKNAGLIVATLLTVVIGILCLYCNHLLVGSCICMRRKLQLELNPNFSETVEFCFTTGPYLFKSWAIFVRITVKVFIVLTQMGFCSIYIVLVSTTLHKVLGDYGYWMDTRLYMVIVYVPIVICCLIRSLKFLTPISMLSNLLLAIAICVTVVLSCFNLPPIGTRKLAGEIAGYPIFFGTVMFAFEGISLVLPLLSEMKKQDTFHSPLGVLNVGIAVVTILVVLVGFIGYLKYGDDTKGTITLNLPQGQVISSVVQIVLAVAIAFTYPIQFYVANEIFWFEIDKKYGPVSHPIIYESLLKIFLVTITLALAILIPKIGLFISLIGAVGSTFLALVYPALCDIAIRCCPEEDLPLRTKYHWLRIAVDLLILVVAFIGFASGTYCSIVEIVNAFVLRGFQTEE